MIALTRRIVADERFQLLVLAVILSNAALVGLQTAEGLVTANPTLFTALDIAIAAFFVVEIGIRILAHGGRPLDFFRDPWNTFDFVIVAVSLTPAVGSFATVARLARLLRVVRLVSFFPELRLLVGTMLRSLVSMGHVLLLLGLVVYVYAVIGYHLFHEHQPVYWGDLGTSLLTLFGVLTLEGWLEVQAESLAVMPLAWVFYGSYVVLAVFIVVNLFIAVVLKNLENVKAEERVERLAAAGADPTLPPDPLGRIERLRDELEALEAEMRRGQAEARYGLTSGGKVAAPG